MNCTGGASPGSGVGIRGAHARCGLILCCSLPQAQADTAEISRNQETSLDVVMPGMKEKVFFFYIYISCDVCVRCCVLCLGSLPFCVQLVLLCVGCVDFYGVALLPYLCDWSW